MLDAGFWMLDAGCWMVGRIATIALGWSCINQLLGLCVPLALNRVCRR